MSASIAASTSPLVISQVLSKFATTLAHERLDEGESAFRVAEMIGEDGERELARLGAFIGPLEAVLAVPAHVEPLVERVAVDGHEDAVDRPIPGVGLHDVAPR